MKSVRELYSVKIVNYSRHLNSGKIGEKLMVLVMPKQAKKKFIAMQLKYFDDYHYCGTWPLSYWCQCKAVLLTDYISSAMKSLAFPMVLQIITCSAAANLVCLDLH